jgi:hypothetical protein
MPVNSQPGAFALHSGRVVAVFALTVRDGLVKHVHAIANPYKLAYVMSLHSPTNKPQGGRRVPSSTGKDAL